ncbi:MAG: DMT family transporter [Caldilineaceae bacterium]|nr:DMT family transporter [Caldilineaceae bacterium]
MLRNPTRPDWQIGFGLSLFTALLFALLPIALKGLLGGMDPITITWYRFFFATLFLLGVIAGRRGFPSWQTMRQAGLGLLLLASVSLCGNYLLYLLALDHLTPGSAQVLIQIAPVLLLVGSLVFYHERFSPLQWGGLGLVMVGMGLFFHNRLNDIFGNFGDYSLGVLIMLGAAVVWAIYGLAQKKLLGTLSAQTIIVCIYGTGAVLFLPLAKPAQISLLTGAQWIFLFFSVAATSVSYVAFAEAMKRWQSSRVSAVLAVVPILTITFVTIGAVLAPALIQPESLTGLSLGGAVLVVMGSVVSSLAQD